MRERAQRRQDVGGMVAGRGAEGVVVGGSVSVVGVVSSAKEDTMAGCIERLEVATSFITDESSAISEVSTTSEAFEMDVASEVDEPLCNLVLCLPISTVSFCWSSASFFCRSLSSLTRWSRPLQQLFMCATRLYALKSEQSR